MRASDSKNRWVRVTDLGSEFSFQLGTLRVVILKITFSVAQAFTPGNKRAVKFKSPINGALITFIVP